MPFNPMRSPGANTLERVPPLHNSFSTHQGMLIPHTEPVNIQDNRIVPNNVHLPSQVQAAQNIRAQLANWRAKYTRR